MFDIFMRWRGTLGLHFACTRVVLKPIWLFLTNVAHFYEVAGEYIKVNLNATKIVETED